MISGTDEEFVARLYIGRRVAVQVVVVVAGRPSAAPPSSTTYPTTTSHQYHSYNGEGNHARILATLPVWVLNCVAKRQGNCTLQCSKSVLLQSCEALQAWVIRARPVPWPPLVLRYTANLTLHCLPLSLNRGLLCRHG